MSTAMLSNNDAAVLGALFDPEASLSNTIRVEDSLPGQFSEAELTAIQQEERQALLLVKDEAPSQDAIMATISQLNLLIERYPQYASGWSNRAQARRMLLNLGPVQSQGSLLRHIVEDLDQAIDLASPKSPAAALSALNAQVLASAFTHRGLLLWAASRSDELRSALTGAVERLAGFDPERLEETASHDFAAGGRYGNDISKQLAVKLNPYAKLCGSIVKEAMQQEISDFYQIPITKVS